MILKNNIILYFHLILQFHLVLIIACTTPLISSYVLFYILISNYAPV